MKRILFVKTSSLGDVVHHLPAVSDAVRAIPGASIDWVIEEAFAAVAAMHPAVRRVIPVALRRWRSALWHPAMWSELGAFRRALAAERYDAVVDTQASYQDEVSEVWYVNSEGTVLFQLRPEVTVSGTATARRNGTIEKGLESIGLRKGWDSVHGLEERFRTVARRAVALLDAPRVQGGAYPVILDNELAGVFVHEAFGHLSEADFVYENPQAREMMTLGRRFGTPVLNVGDNGAAAGLRGTLPFDDEGTATQDTPLIKDGILVGRLHSRETAAALGERPTGNARAISFRHPPIVRMTNTYIAPGPGGGSFDDLIKDVKLGVYACGAFGGQTMLENFSFTAAWGHMIRDGHVAELVKDVVLAGNLFQTLDRIDHIAGDFTWNQVGGGCGKGGQFPLPVTEGAPHVRIEQALVGGNV